MVVNVVAVSKNQTLGQAALPRDSPASADAAPETVPDDDEDDEQDDELRIALQALAADSPMPKVGWSARLVMACRFTRSVNSCSRAACPLSDSL